VTTTLQETIRQIMARDIPMMEKREALLKAGLTQGAVYAIIAASQAKA
jgi:hypothetical protein